MYIVGFNGPPRSGKDTLAKMLAQHMVDQGIRIPVHTIPLSRPLREIAYAMSGHSGLYTGLAYEAFKTQDYPQFGGKTGRQLMIDVSESFLKPMYGQDVMAKLLLESIPSEFNSRCIVLVPDSGFQCEVSPIVNEVGAGNFFLARVHRKGCSFEGDSREWVEHAHAGDFDNNGTLDDLRTEAGRIYGRLVNKMGWKL